MSKSTKSLLWVLGGLIFFAIGYIGVNIANQRSVENIQQGKKPDIGAPVK